MAEYIQYVVGFRLKDKDLPKRRESRKELIAKAKERSRQLGERIQKKFPEIKIIRTTIFGPTLDIPKRSHEKLAEEIHKLFDCDIAERIRQQS